MSSFTAPLRYESTDRIEHGRRIYRLIDPVTYHVGAEGSSLSLTVEAGFLTDLASVPRLFRNVFAPDGPWAQAAVVHDKLYREGLVSRQLADLIFLEGMKVLGVPWRRRYTMYLAVRVGGMFAYRRELK